jgi:hypothetical protein
MRKRIIAAAVVMGLGMMGLALAQQGSQQPKDQASEKAKLRTQVVKLRLEIELLQLDHDAARDILIACLKQVNQPEGLRSGQPGPMVTMDFNMLGMAALMGNAEAQKKAERAVEKGEDAWAALQKAMEEAEKEQTDRIRAYIGSKRKEFAKQAAELADKRLELADLEKRYNESK